MTSHYRIRNWSDCSAAAWARFVEETFEHKPRKRTVGAGRKRYYGGKQKSHTVKNNVITDRRGKMLYLSGSSGNRTSHRRR